MRTKLNSIWFGILQYEMAWSCGILIWSECQLYFHELLELTVPSIHLLIYNIHILFREMCFNTFWMQRERERERMNERERARASAIPWKTTYDNGLGQMEWAERSQSDLRQRISSYPTQPMPCHCHATATEMRMPFNATSKPKHQVRIKWFSHLCN